MTDSWQLPQRNEQPKNSDVEEMLHAPSEMYVATCATVELGCERLRSLADKQPFATRSGRDLRPVEGWPMTPLFATQRVGAILLQLQERDDRGLD